MGVNCSLILGIGIHVLLSFHSIALITDFYQLVFMNYQCKVITVYECHEL